MGYADIQTTMKYLHYESRKEDAQLVARAFRLPGSDEAMGEPSLPIRGGYARARGGARARERGSSGVRRAAAARGVGWASALATGFRWRVAVDRSRARNRASSSSWHISRDQDAFAPALYQARAFALRRSHLV
jgi:hypothetical protein